MQHFWANFTILLFYYFIVDSKTKESMNKVDNTYKKLRHSKDSINFNVLYAKEKKIGVSINTSVNNIKNN